jgi:hypothetical protein
MARIRGRSEVRARSTREIDRLLRLERLRGATIPLVLAASALLAWVLGSAGVVGIDEALLGVAGAAIALCAFFGLRDFIDERTNARRALVVAGFAAAFAVATIYPLEQTLFPGRPLASGELALGGAPIAVQADAGGAYRIVVDGHLPQSSDRASQSETYRLRVERDGVEPIEVTGEFSDRWSMRRLGRRGSAPVHIVRATAQHTVEVPSGATFRVALADLSPKGGEAVSIRVHRAPAPSAPVLVGAGVALVSAAAVIDAWRLGESEGLMTALTFGAVVWIGAFRRFAPAHPGFGDLAFNGAIGGLAGLVGGAGLWRAVRSRLRG